VSLYAKVKVYLCFNWIWLAIINTTLGVGLPPTALHYKVRSLPSVLNNLLGGITFSKLTLDGGTIVQTHFSNINTLFL
jgi:hypothetical protein